MNTLKYGMNVELLSEAIPYIISHPDKIIHIGWSDGYYTFKHRYKTNFPLRGAGGITFWYIDVNGKDQFGRAHGVDFDMMNVIPRNLWNDLISMIEDKLNMSIGEFSRDQWHYFTV